MAWDRDAGTVTLTCTRCKGDVIITVTEPQMKEYLSGEGRHVQQIFPNLTPAEREMFISGICGPCWNRIFSKDPSEVSGGC